MLIFLSYLVKAPALPARPSWLPAPIVILARSASNALHAASPSSVRSRSSSSSIGGSRSRTHSAAHGQAHGQGQATHHGKEGKGTPTSVHSFGHGGGGIGLSSGSGSAPNSFRSVRTGGMRRRSRGAEAGTPTSYRSGGSVRSGMTRDIDITNAGLHIPADTEDEAEVSVGETTHEQQHK